MSWVWLALLLFLVWTIGTALADVTAAVVRRRRDKNTTNDQPTPGGEL